MTKPAILIVEDHDIVRRSLRDWLNISFRGFCVVEAKSGEEAVEMVRATPPCLVLMDVGLPQMSGIEATQQIKQIAPQLPVIILSIHESSAYTTAAGQAGADAYIPKRKLQSDLNPTIARLLPSAEKDALPA